MQGRSAPLPGRGPPSSGRPPPGSSSGGFAPQSGKSTGKTPGRTPRGAFHTPKVGSSHGQGSRTAGGSSKAQHTGSRRDVRDDYLMSVSVRAAWCSIVFFTAIIIISWCDSWVKTLSNDCSIAQENKHREVGIALMSPRSATILVLNHPHSLRDNTLHFSMAVHIYVYINAKSLYACACVRGSSSFFQTPAEIQNTCFWTIEQWCLADDDDEAFHWLLLVWLA